MTPANMSFLSALQRDTGKVRRRQESIKNAARKLRNSLGQRTETSPPAFHSASPSDSVLGALPGASREQATVARRSWTEDRQFAQPLVPSPSSLPPSPKAEDSDASSLFSSSLVPSARRRE